MPALRCPLILGLHQTEVYYPALVLVTEPNLAQQSSDLP